MNDKANTATPAYGTPSELESEFRDGIPSALSTITVYGNWGTLTCDASTGDVLRYDFSDSDSECNTDGYADIVRVDIHSFHKSHGTITGPIDILLIGFWTANGKYEAPVRISQPETVSDYFKRVYPEYYVQIITNMNADHGPTVTAIVLSSTAYTNELHCAFIWADSPEGHEFWRAVAQREAQ